MKLFRRGQRPAGTLPSPGRAPFGQAGSGRCLRSCRRRLAGRAEDCGQDGDVSDDVDDAVVVQVEAGLIARHAGIADAVIVWVTALGAKYAANQRYVSYDIRESVGVEVALRLREAGE